MTNKQFRSLHAAINDMQSGRTPDLSFLEYFKLFPSRFFYRDWDIPPIESAIEMQRALSAHIRQFRNDQAALQSFRELLHRYEQGDFDPPAPKVVKRKVGRVGFIYLCRSAYHKFTKIGFSKQPTVREQTLQAEDPQLEIFFCPTDGWRLRARHSRQV